MGAGTVAPATTIVVAYDGTRLSERGLALAATMGAVHDQELLAVSVVPDNEEYAREKGWIDDDESFDAETVLGRLRERVRSIAPGAGFEYELVGRFAPAGEIRRLDRLRRGVSDDAGKRGYYSSS